MRKIPAEDVIDALYKANGNVSQAARILGCSRQTVHNKINNLVTVKEAYEDARETRVDWMESKLDENIEEGDTRAIIYGLTTMGRTRGYGKQVAVTGADGEPLKVEYVNDWRNAKD